MRKILLHSVKHNELFQVFCYTGTVLEMQNEQIHILMDHSDKIMALKGCVIDIMCLIPRKNFLRQIIFMSIDKFKYIDIVLFHFQIFQKSHMCHYL